MGKITRTPFDTAAFLAAEGPGRTIINHAAKHILYSQGSPADAVYYLQTGRAKLNVISKNGKEATVTLLAQGDFFGEESMAGAGTRRTVTAKPSPPAQYSGSRRRNCSAFWRSSINSPLFS